MLKLSLAAVTLLMSVGCATVPLPIDMSLSGDTRFVTGWLQDGAEPILFPRPLSERYDPFGPENHRCISMIDETDLSGEEFTKLAGQRVSVVGYTVLYSSLPLGRSDIDRLLTKRYYGNIEVLNSCLRERIFIVKEISRVPLLR